MTWLKSSKGQRNLNFLLSHPCSLHGSDSFCASSQEFLHLSRCTCTHTHVAQPLTAETHGAEGQLARASLACVRSPLATPAGLHLGARLPSLHTHLVGCHRARAVRPVPPPMLIWTFPMTCETRQHCSRHRCGRLAAASQKAGGCECQWERQGCPSGTARHPTPAESSALGTTCQRWQPEHCPLF